MTKTLLGLLLLSLLPLVLPADDRVGLKWEADIAALEAADRANPPPPGAILFTGSSSIRLWDLKQSFPDLPAVNHGFGGSTIAENTAYAPRLVLPLRPRTIVFYGGDNDSAQGRTAVQIAADFEAYARCVHKALPEARILYLPIKPSIARWHLRDLQHDANQRIQRFCEANRDWLRFVDTALPLLGPDGKPDPRFFEADGLHLNAQGYARWTPLVRKAIEAGKEK